jgi:hypothetical protein
VPHSALTRWLKQGLTRNMCPLCRAAHKLDREYMWNFFDERSSDEDALDQVAAARGFCAEHAEQLRRIEVDGLKSTIAITDVYEHTLHALAADLAGLDDGGADALAATVCPACANRDQGVERNARYLLDEVAESAVFRERFRVSPGLCVAHFRLTWNASRTSEERALLRDTELDAVRSLLGEVREHLRRQRAEHRTELPGAEAGSWQRALWLTGGWPAPAASAGTPERAGENQRVRPSS